MNKVSQPRDPMGDLKIATQSQTSTTPVAPETPSPGPNLVEQAMDKAFAAFHAASQNLTHEDRTTAAPHLATPNAQAAIGNASVGLNQSTAGLPGTPVPLSEKVGQTGQSIEVPKLIGTFDANFQNVQLQGFWPTSVNLVKSITDGSFKKEIQSFLPAPPPVTPPDIVPPEPIPVPQAQPNPAPGDYGDPTEGAGPTGVAGQGGDGGGNDGELGPGDTEKLC